MRSINCSGGQAGVCGAARAPALSTAPRLLYLHTLGETAGNFYSALAASNLLAEVLTIQGRLRQGARLCQDTVDRYLARHGEQVTPTLGHIYITLGGILYEWNDLEAATYALGHALSLAEPEGYCRTFVDQGPPMAALPAVCLLHPGPLADRDRPCSADYLQQLLAAFPARETEPDALSSVPASPALAYLPDPLNDREIEVLQLLAAGLTTPEIATRLILAPSTIKWYLRNIYSKLGVHRRFDAVAQAKPLGLLQ